MPKKIDITGQRYGRLIAVRREPGRRWIFACDCGRQKSIAMSDVRSGCTRSCGCLLSQATTARLTKHGMCKTPEYFAWQQMINRCTNPKYQHFHCYGGRGIQICERWMKFENFFFDMGFRPSPKHSLDRRETNGNYEPGNCRWATKQEQSCNMRKNIFIEHAGKRLTMSQWARELGISPGAFWHRYNKYGDIERSRLP